MNMPKKPSPSRESFVNEHHIASNLYLYLGGIFRFVVTWVTFTIYELQLAETHARLAGVQRSELKPQHSVRNGCFQKNAVQGVHTLKKKKEREKERHPAGGEARLKEKVPSIEEVWDVVLMKHLMGVMYWSLCTESNAWLYIQRHPVTGPGGITPSILCV